MYGANETNGLTDSDTYYSREFAHMRLAQLVAQGGKVTRVRFLTERHYGGRVADLSYVHGELADGTPVRVEGLPALYLAAWKRGVYSELIAWAKDEGVYAKGCGLLDESNWSVLY